MGDLEIRLILPFYFPIMDIIISMCESCLTDGRMRNKFSSHRDDNTTNVYTKLYIHVSNAERISRNSTANRVKKRKKR